MSVSETLQAREMEINNLVDQGSIDEAKSKLFDLIVFCAGKGDLANANRLRDQLYEVDPMALNDIIKANEMIEEAMSGAVNDQFAKAWAGLRDTMTEDEFLPFYHSLAQHDFESGKTVVSLGSKLDAVCFVNQGNISVTCRCGEKTVEVMTLEPGEMISENCFQPSRWTVNLTCNTPVNMSVLRLEQLVQLEEQFPGLEQKLASFSERFNTIWSKLTELEEDRRQARRHRTDQRITFQVLNKDGVADERTFRGELVNISEKGLAFIIRIVKRDNRRMLFGRKVVVSVPPEAGTQQFTGSVVAISCYDIQEHDYAVHVAFESPVPADSVQQLILPEPEELTVDSGDPEQAEEQEFQKDQGPESPATDQ